MAAKKFKFLQAVSTEYREKCPELSRVMMMNCFDRLNGPDMEEFSENYQAIEGKTCEHCGTVFTNENSTFRIKPKRKRKKKRTVKDKTKPKCLGVMPKSSNFLQILCHYCGWKTRQIGAMRDTRRSTKDSNGSSTSTSQNESHQFYNKTDKLPGVGKTTGSPISSPKWCASPSSSGLHHSLGNRSGNKRKAKSRLKELLAKEKSESVEKMSSPSLINFLSSI